METQPTFREQPKHEIEFIDIDKDDFGTFSQLLGNEQYDPRREFRKRRLGLLHCWRF